MQAREFKRSADVNSLRRNARQLFASYRINERLSGARALFPLARDIVRQLHLRSPIEAIDSILKQQAPAFAPSCIFIAAKSRRAQRGREAGVSGACERLARGPILR